MHMDVHVDVHMDVPTGVCGAAQVTLDPGKSPKLHLMLQQTVPPRAATRHATRARVPDASLRPAA